MQSTNLRQAIAKWFISGSVSLPLLIDRIRTAFKKRTGHLYDVALHPLVASHNPFFPQKASSLTFSAQRQFRRRAAAPAMHPVSQSLCLVMLLNAIQATSPVSLLNRKRRVLHVWQTMFNATLSPTFFACQTYVPQGVRRV